VRYAFPPVWKSGAGEEGAGEQGSRGGAGEQGGEGEGENTSFYNAADTDADMDEIKHSQQAFQSVRQQLGKTYLPLINGSTKPQEKIDSVNPPIRVVVESD